MSVHRLVAKSDFCPLSGKRIYPSRESAERALEQKQRAGLPVTRAYACKGCDGFHLTCEGRPAQRRAR